jgi:hypothetical protein
MSLTILRSHTSFETAYQVASAPYCYNDQWLRPSEKNALPRCKKRYWLDKHPKNGVRLAERMTNPTLLGKLLLGLFDFLHRILDSSVTTSLFDHDEFWNKTHYGRCHRFGVLYLEANENCGFRSLPFDCSYWHDADFRSTGLHLQFNNDEWAEYDALLTDARNGAQKNRRSFEEGDRLENAILLHAIVEDGKGPCWDRDTLYQWIASLNIIADALHRATFDVAFNALVAEGKIDVRADGSVRTGTAIPLSAGRILPDYCNCEATQPHVYGQKGQ